MLLVIVCVFSRL